jgi:hypothetical protein
MSAAVSTWLQSNCSGAMKRGVPITTPVLVSALVSSSIRAMPKSVTTTRQGNQGVTQRA